MTTYQKLKAILKETAEEVRVRYKNDKPAQRMAINDTCDELIRSSSLSENKCELLTRYACKLHPNDKIN